jgi:fimbrial chaperone protein
MSSDYTIFTEMKTKIHIKLILVACVLVIILPCNAFSGDWRVTPIRLDLGKDAKSSVITVTNEAEEKLNVQMKAMEWSQDADGKDVYTDTSDIIFFPKIMTIEKKEDRIIRVGIKALAVLREKTYRLFVEEIPEPKKAQGTSVAIAIRFGVPIFVIPVKEEEKGEIGKIELSKGVLSAVVKNTGNQHFRINSINVKGKNTKGEEVFATELSGWYLLTGVARTYSTILQKEACDKTAKVEVEVKTEKFTLNGKLDVDKAMCSP